MTHNIINQYRGFITTPNLWNGLKVLNLEQFEVNHDVFQDFNSESFNEIRLGKRVEQFFNFQIKKSKDYKLLASNVQIKDEKITIGELDALIQSETETFHIEIIYKFYLYDPNIESANELDKWIGPNQKDTLVYKLHKLKQKQLPLLHSANCKTVLQNLNLDINSITQQVCYKAQLFLPFQSINIDISPLNKDCIYGFYLCYHEIEKLSEYQIFIPKKLDWLKKTTEKVWWRDFDVGKQLISEYIDEKRSPMIWLKSKNGKLQKCFITFW